MAVSDLRIGLIQTELHWENKAANLDSLEKIIRKSDKVCDLIILPEMFSTGFSMNSEKLSESMEGETLQWMKKVSAESNAVLCGSFIAVEKGHYHNRLVWMQSDGNYLHYDKRHLFRMAGEDAYYTAGNNNILVNLNGWKIRPLICYDLRFPVWCRNRYSRQSGTAAAEFDLMIFCANWPSARILAWDSLLRARAIENQVYCIGVNRIGKDGNGIEYSGHSAVIGPKGNYILEPAESGDKFLFAKINYADLSIFREKFPQGLDADDFKLSQQGD